jgi:Ulp1 family protease
MILDGQKINIKIDFSKYSIITGGYHRDANNHWILWLVKYSTDSKTGSIYCMDSLNSVTYKELTTFVDNWKAFANSRRSLSGIEWTLMPNSALSQTDSYNCGVHVCYNFLRLINGLIPLKINMDEYRSEI